MTFFADALLENSPWAQATRRRVELSASADVPALITGPSGSGKSYLARVLHAAGPRRDAPLMTLDAALLPGTLFHGEAFGHASGGLLRGVGAALGALRAAGEGTVVIENVDQLSPEAQRDLAMALRDRAVTPLGLATTTPFAARVIATSEADVAALAAAGQFDPALAALLLVCPIPISGLRDRPEDVAPLLAHFLCELAGASDAVEFSPAAIEWLQQWAWPRNVAELKGLVAKVVASGQRRIGRSAVRRVLSPDVSPWSGDLRFVERTRFPGLNGQRSLRGACHRGDITPSCRGR